ncbi:MAG TPA: PilW family protein [Povalibacter sp.]|nr:PilW family protein [Povalibacter sp.]
MRRFFGHGRARQTGFTVVEILVAMVISLLLLAGIMTLFANSRTSYESNDRLARIQENGRLGLELIARDVRAAGYWGCAKRTAAKPLRNVLNNSTDLLWNFGVPVQGFDATATGWSPALVAPADTDRADTDSGGPDVDGPTLGSDVLVVRGPKRDSTPQMVQTSMGSGTADLSVYKPATNLALNDIAIAGSCDQASVFQVTAYTAGSGTNPDVVAHAASGTPGNSGTDLGNRFYANQAEVFPVETVVYFVDTSTATPAPGVTSTSLWRRAGSNAPEEVVEGVDSFQVSFGIDTDHNRLADTYKTANDITDWDQVISVRVALLVRSLTEYGSDQDTTARTLLGQSVAAFNDRRQRLVFTTTVNLRNKVF